MQPLKTRILAMISVFEGSANGRINVWDEQFLSVGTLQYAVRMGPGQRFLTRIYQLDPAGFTRCLGVGLAAAARTGGAALATYCARNIWKTGNRWAGAFAALSRLPAYQQADAELSAGYFASAQAIAGRYGLTSERGLAFAMDRCVQQGGAARPWVDQTFRKLGSGKPEYEVMKALAVAYSQTANPKYVGVVQKRSLTVALGNSVYSGYPGNVNLERDFGISAGRAWRGQI